MPRDLRNAFVGRVRKDRQGRRRKAPLHDCAVLNSIRGKEEEEGKKDESRRQFGQSVKKRGDV